MQMLLEAKCVGEPVQGAGVQREETDEGKSSNINNHPKCKQTELTNKKAQSNRLEPKTKPNQMAFKRHISAARTNRDSE